MIIYFSFPLRIRKAAVKVLEKIEIYVLGSITFSENPVLHETT